MASLPPRSWCPWRAVRPSRPSTGRARHAPAHVSRAPAPGVAVHRGGGDTRAHGVGRHRRHVGHDSVERRRRHHEPVVGAVRVPDPRRRDDGGHRPGFVVFIGGCSWLGHARVVARLVVAPPRSRWRCSFSRLALAALVWPSVAHWCRRLADTLVALVLSKLVVAAVLSFAASAVAGGVGASREGREWRGLRAVVAGIALLVVAVLSPFTLCAWSRRRGGAVAHLESTRHRLKSAAMTPVRTGGNLALEQMRADGDRCRGGTAVSVGTVGPSAPDVTTGPQGHGGDRGHGGPGGCGGSGGSGCGASDRHGHHRWVPAMVVSSPDWRCRSAGPRAGGMLAGVAVPGGGSPVVVRVAVARLPGLARHHAATGRCSASDHGPGRRRLTPPGPGVPRAGG